MKQLVMKEWFANKKAQELQTNLYDDGIFAILKETEKAYYVMISLAPAKSKCFWIPKSATELRETEYAHLETKTYEDYDVALDEFKLMWSNFMQEEIMKINIKQIEELVFDPTISAYSLEAETGISRANISNYRKGTQDIENMTLKHAMKLQEYLNRKEEENNMEHLVLEHSGYDIYTEKFENLSDALSYAEKAFNRLSSEELKTNYIEVVKNYSEDEYSPESFNVSYDPIKTFKDKSYKELK